MKLIVLLTTCMGVGGYAAADLSLLKDLTGLHPLGSLQLSNQVSGLYEIVATAEEIGVRIKGDPRSFTLPAENTVLTRAVNKIIQESISGSTLLTIVYALPTVTIKHCVLEACKEVLINGVPSPFGTSVDPKTFFTSIAGTYRIDTINGQPAHPNVTGEVLVTSNEEAESSMQFCLPSGSCIDGYTQYFFSQMEIFSKSLSPTRSIHTFFMKEGEKRREFSWEQNEGLLTFRNFQFESRDAGRISMEHVIRK